MRFVVAVQKASPSRFEVVFALNEPFFLANCSARR